MRAVSLHRDALLVTSRLWQTTCVAVRSQAGDRGEAFLIDSPYFPDELELLPSLLDQAGFAIDGLLATHADFDHLLGRLAYPGKALGVAESTAQRLKDSPGSAQRELREADAAFYVRRSGALSLGSIQVLPVPGQLELANTQIELYVAEGHTSDGVAFLVRECGLLVCGDYLSDVEIPLLGEGGAVSVYRDTLERLGALAREAEMIVPGHGSPQTPEQAQKTLEEDLRYLDSLERGDTRGAIPTQRDSKRQREVHTENLRRAAAT